MSFSVITPTFNAARWIPGCIASVADQEAFQVEHIVQDGGSTDNTAVYLLSQPLIRAVVEKDEGMYDAINRGWRKATGDFAIHLNADEQLLPGALGAVRDCFFRNPQTDVVIGGTLICGPDGHLLCYRKALRPPLSMLLTCHHPVPSCSIFLRRSGFLRRSNLYDPSFRLISDALLMIDILRSRTPIVLLNQFTSVFFWTGENLGLCQSEEAEREYRHQMSLAPRWLQLAKPAIRGGFHIRKLITGHYWQDSIRYGIYTPDNPGARSAFEVRRPSGIYYPARTVRSEYPDSSSV